MQRCLKHKRLIAVVRTQADNAIAYLRKENKKLSLKEAKAKLRELSNSQLHEKLGEASRKVEHFIVSSWDFEKFIKSKDYKTLMSSFNKIRDTILKSPDLQKDAAKMMQFFDDQMDQILKKYEGKDRLFDELKLMMFIFQSKARALQALAASPHNNA